MRKGLKPIWRVLLAMGTLFVLCMPVENAYAAQATMIVRAQVIFSPQIQQAADTAYVFEADNSNLKVYL